MLVSQTQRDMFANALASPGQTSLDFFDALYFTVITSLTVGFGDVCPRRDTGRAFTIFMGGVGIGERVGGGASSDVIVQALLPTPVPTTQPATQQEPLEPACGAQAARQGGLLLSLSGSVRRQN